MDGKRGQPLQTQRRPRGLTGVCSELWMCLWPVLLRARILEYQPDSIVTCCIQLLESSVMADGAKFFSYRYVNVTVTLESKFETALYCQYCNMSR